MTERPILFSAPMVRAIVAGTKTQTRRVVKLPHMNPLGHWEPTTFGGLSGGRLADGSTIPEQGGIWHTRTGDHLGCPYGQPGDRLWVREAWRTEPALNPCPPREIAMVGAPVQYEAGPHADVLGGKLRPGMFMPRGLSRITLEVTGVRVERLQDISEADAQAEGAEPYRLPCHPDREALRHVDGFHALWESINGPGSWDANPWVWVISFTRLEAPR